MLVVWPGAPQAACSRRTSHLRMQGLAAARGLEVDTRAISLAGLAILLALVLASLVLSSLGCLFLVSLLSITVYCSSNLAQR